MQSGRARTASYAHGRSASVACGLGQLKVALRPRSPSSQSGASRIEWKFDFSCREWMDCLVECEQLGSAGSLWCNMFSGRQQTRARERVFQRTLQSNTQDTLRDSLQGGTRFFIRVWGLIVHYGRRNRRRLARGWFYCGLTCPKNIHDTKNHIKSPKSTTKHSPLGPNDCPYEGETNGHTCSVTLVLLCAIYA